MKKTLKLRQLHRTAQRKSVLIEVVDGNAGSISNRGIRRRNGVQRGAPQELVNRSVELIRAGLRRQVNDTAGRFAVFRVVSRCLHLKLRDGVDRRDPGQVVSASLRVVWSAVQKELVLA